MSEHHVTRIGDFIHIGGQHWLVSYIVVSKDGSRKLVVFRDGVRKTVAEGDHVCVPCYLSIR